MSILIHIGTIVLNIIYTIMKLCPVQRKITYISRQMNTVPLDFALTKECMEKKYPQYKHKILAKMIPSSLFGKINYCFYMFVQMYHIATSQVVILDTYCIPISILKQRDDLIVIQMWHALGAFKKFGYSILDQEEGSSSTIAKLMKMHQNYTYVLSSSELTAPYFQEAFHVRQEQIKIYPLPRVDLLLNQNEKKKIVDKIYSQYPSLKNTRKKIIVYAPTFRKGDNTLKDGVYNLLNHIDFDKYIVIFKKHPLTSLHIHDDRIIEDNEFTSLEFFHVADVMITDYSAVLFEASMLHKPIYFYAFDLKSYMKKRDFYVDYQTMMPGPVFEDPQLLIDAIENNEYDLQKIEEFQRLMIAPCQKSYTEDLVDFIYQQLQK